MLMREVHTLLAVADAGSFLSAARVLFRTPASVMNQINKLELMVGVKLLKRTSQGVRLTAAGEAFLTDMRKLQKLADEAVNHARQIASENRNIIRIGSSLLRPATRLIDLCEKTQNCPFQFHIMSFTDDPDCLNLTLSSLGRQIDCIVGPCDSIEWQTKYSILKLEEIPCRIAVARIHPLAKKDRLSWNDLDGEEFMLIQRGDSPVLNRMRDDILRNHPGIRIKDAAHKYDTNAFNECLHAGCLMETLDVWKEAHPSLVTLPMEWNYAMPYGLIYAKEPTPALEDFIAFVRGLCTV